MHTNRKLLRSQIKQYIDIKSISIFMIDGCVTGWLSMMSHIFLNHYNMPFHLKTYQTDKNLNVLENTNIEILNY